VSAAAGLAAIIADVGEEAVFTDSPVMPLDMDHGGYPRALLFVHDHGSSVPAWAEGRVMPDGARYAVAYAMADDLPEITDGETCFLDSDSRVWRIEYSLPLRERGQTFGRRMLCRSEQNMSRGTSGGG